MVATLCFSMFCNVSHSVIPQELGLRRILKKQKFTTMQQPSSMFSFLADLQVLFTLHFASVSQMSPLKCIFGCEGNLADNDSVNAVCPSGLA